MTPASVDWLLGSPEPAIRALTRRDLLDEQPDGDVLSGPMVQALLAGDPRPHPYSKWTGAHWRLVSLVELGVPPSEPAWSRSSNGSSGG